MARHLRDALRLENLLTSAGIDYAVETGPYTSGFLIKRELTGAYFYVEERIVGTARVLLSANKYVPFNPD